LGHCFLLREIVVFEFVLVSLFLTVLFSNSNSAFTALAIFLWLLLFPSRGAYRLILICSPLTFITTLHGPLRGLSHLFDQFLTFCNYFSVVLVLFGFTVGELTIFSLI